ncbi:MAG TPA: trypsin-like peptidase domain-containing protein [Ktedonobacteraceae bacterium]|nr:trypsin-like peptidase domain-containing protein [Ktedonobacteraceae bacterium]
MSNADRNEEKAEQPFDCPKDANRAFSKETSGGDARPVEYRPVAPLAPVGKGALSCFLVAMLVGGLLLLGVGGLIGWSVGKNKFASLSDRVVSYRSADMTVEQIIERDRQAVVQVNVPTEKGVSIGSGVIIDTQGHIVTNDHVISGGQRENVTLFDGTVLPARVVGVDPPDDLAVLKINPPRKIYAMPIGDSTRLQAGNQVLAIGNPLGITQTVTNGIVSALGRIVPEGPGGGTIINAVQTDAPINPGNSGGALVDMDGDLVGIPTLVAVDPEFKIPANGVGFAIPSDRVKFIAPQLIRYGKVVHSGRAALGASVITVDPVIAAQANLAVDHGALITSVVPNGPAARAGLRAGDVIVQVGNTQINSQADLAEALLAYDPGATANLGIVRGTRQMQVKVKLGELSIS